MKQIAIFEIQKTFYQFYEKSNIPESSWHKNDFVNISEKEYKKLLRLNAKIEESKSILQQAYRKARIKADRERRVAEG